MAAQELCLHALSKAVDVLPDSFWHGIPGGFFKPSKDKKELKEKIEEREKEVESKLTRHHNRRRTSEEHKSGRGRHADDRKDRRRRAASASPHSKQYSDEDREHRRGRRGRERNSDDKHESQKRNDMSTNDYYLPMSLAGLNGVAGSRPSTAQSSHPSQAYSPAAYAGSPIAQAPPYQHPTQPAQTVNHVRCIHQIVV